jgi:aminodeoxyfutalosine deaminase
MLGKGIEQDNEPSPVTGSPHVLTAQWILPVSRPPIQNGYLAFADGKITRMGKISELGEETISLPRPRTLITPGLVNCHTHLEQSFPTMISKAPEEPFTNWLLKVVTLIKQHASSQDKTQRCLQGAEELLRTGTTCVNDIASGPESLRVLAEKGLRGIVSLEVFHPGAVPVKVAHWVQGYTQLQQTAGANPLLVAGLSPHSPYNVSPAAWQALLDACRPPIVHTHIAEFADEQRYLQGEPSTMPEMHQAILNQPFAPQALARSPVEYLHGFQLLNAHTIAAHAIETSIQDRQLLAEAKVGIAHCPRSNLTLHGKTLKARDWQDERSPIGLGTDGRLSTEDLDLRAEARCAMQQHGWSAAHALEALTLQGARVLQMAHAIGSLEVGKQADFVVWQASQADDTAPEAQVLNPSTRAEQIFIAGACQWERENSYP